MVFFLYNLLAATWACVRRGEALHQTRCVKLVSTQSYDVVCPRECFHADWAFLRFNHRCIFRNLCCLCLPIPHVHWRPHHFIHRQHPGNTRRANDVIPWEGWRSWARRWEMTPFHKSFGQVCHVPADSRIHHGQIVFTCRRMIGYNPICHVYAHICYDGQENRRRLIINCETTECRLRVCSQFRNVVNPKNVHHLARGLMGCSKLQRKKPEAIHCARGGSGGNRRGWGFRCNRNLLPRRSAWWDGLNLLCLLNLLCTLRSLVVLNLDGEFGFQNILFLPRKYPSWSLVTTCRVHQSTVKAPAENFEFLFDCFCFAKDCHRFRTVFDKSKWIRHDWFRF